MGNQIDENESLYSDQENVWAAQMAYCNIDKGKFKMDIAECNDLQTDMD